MRWACVRASGATITRSRCEPSDSPPAPRGGTGSGPLLAFAAALAVAGCRREVTVIPRGLLRTAMVEPACLSPLLCSAYEAEIVTLWVAEPLVEWIADGSHAPRVAESFERSSDGLTITFKLRRGLVFTDGTPLTSEHVVKTFQFVLEPASRAAALRGGLGPLESVASPQPGIVTLTWKRPYAYALTGLARVPILRAPGESPPVGSGRFAIAEHRPGERLKLTRSDRYVTEAPTMLSAIDVRFVKDRETAFAAALRGDLDLLRVGASAWRARGSEIESKEGWRAVAVQNPSYLSVAFNLDRKPFDDRRVRLALARLLDTATISLAMYKGAFVPAAGPWPPTSRRNDPGTSPVRKDEAGARKLLAEAGFQDRDGDGKLDREGKPLTVVLRHAPGAIEDRELPVYLESAWSKAGITVELRASDLPTLMKDTAAGDFDAVYAGYFRHPAADPSGDWHGGPAARAAGNWSNLADPAIDRLLDEAVAAPDPAAAEALLVRVHRRLGELTPHIFLFHPSVHTVIGPRIQTLTQHPYFTTWDLRWTEVR